MSWPWWIPQRPIIGTTGGSSMPWADRVIGFSSVTLTLAPGEMPPNIFHSGNFWYAQAADGTWWYVGGARSQALAMAIVNGGNIDLKGRPFGRADVRFVRAIPALPTSEAMKGVPRPVWPRIDDSTSVAFSWQLDCMRWLRVSMFVDTPNNQTIEIPLIDDDGLPWIDAAQPPTMIARRADISGQPDRVNDVGHSGDEWTDANMMIRPAGSAAANRSYTGEEYFIRLVPRTDPVPHWCLIVTGDHAAGTNNRNVIVDLFGSGGGVHASATREEGSATVAGHWKAELMWSQQVWNTAPVLAELNERIHASGCIYVANAAEVPGTPATLFLTTGVNQGLSTGTQLFSALPAVIVLGHADLATDVTASAQSAWKPESWGMGCRSASTGTQNAAGHKRAYYSSVFLDAGSGKYAVKIWNIGTIAGAPSATLDRTFFVFCLGK